MSELRAVLILCSVVSLSACGPSSQSSDPADTKQTPPIEAIDEPAEVNDFTALLDAPDDMYTTHYWCLDEEQTGAREDCPTPEQKEQLRRQREEYLRALKPAEGVEPRAIARLRLSGRDPKSYARLVAWRNGSDKLCVQTEIEDEGGSPNGPCIPREPCGKLCLDLDISDSGDGTETRYLLTGLVDPKADELRMTLEDGRVDAYGLTGPLVPGFPEYRVFMLDLGRELYRRLELRLGDKVLAEETLSSKEIRILRCMERSPPVLPSQDRSSSRGAECLPRAEPK